MQVKAYCGGVQMFKNMRVVILFDMFLNPNFKMMTSFPNVARTTASTSKFISQGKFLLLNEVKTRLMLKYSLQNSLQSSEKFIFNMVRQVTNLW